MDIYPYILNIFIKFLINKNRRLKSVEEINHLYFVYYSVTIVTLFSIPASVNADFILSIVV